MIRIKRASLAEKDLFLLESTLTEAGIESEWRPRLKNAEKGLYRDENDPFLEVRKIKNNELISIHYNRHNAYLNASSEQAPWFDKLLSITKTEYPYPKWFETAIVMVELAAVSMGIYYIISL